MTFVDVLLVLAFALQAAGIVMVAIAAWIYPRHEHRLGYLVWGGAAVTSIGTAILLAALFLAAVSAHH